MSHIDFSADTSGADRRLARLERGPELDDLIRFEQVLVAQYVASQAHVHRITQSLARSGRIDSDYGAGRWVGRLTYGGPSAGSVHNPVRYAQVEQSRAGDRDGLSHNFMEPVPEIGRAYVDAIEAFFAGTA